MRHLVPTRGLIVHRMPTRREPRKGRFKGALTHPLWASRMRDLLPALTLRKVALFVPAGPERGCTSMRESLQVWLPILLVCPRAVWTDYRPPRRPDGRTHMRELRTGRRRVDNAIGAANALGHLVSASHPGPHNGSHLHEDLRGHEPSFAAGSRAHDSERLSIGYEPSQPSPPGQGIEQRFGKNSAISRRQKLGVAAISVTVAATEQTPPMAEEEDVWQASR